MSNNTNLQLFETPWLKRQVENHLLFGYFARRMPFVNAYALATCIAAVLAIRYHHGLRLWDLYLLTMALSSMFYLRKLPRYQQAAFGWIITKSCLMLVSFLSLITGGLGGFSRGSADAWHITILALLWLPLLEFVPALVKQQKFITLVRIASSIPLTILWQRTGTWK